MHAEGLNSFALHEMEIIAKGNMMSTVFSYSPVLSQFRKGQQHPPGCLPIQFAVPTYHLPCLRNHPMGLQLLIK